MLDSGVVNGATVAVSAFDFAGAFSFVLVLLGMLVGLVVAKMFLQGL